jgi:hypothetical protein
VVNPGIVPVEDLEIVPVEQQRQKRAYRRITETIRQRVSELLIHRPRMSIKQISI